MGAAAFRAGSRTVPHIPQNRKLLELTSPHFGQITWASPDSVFLECNSEDAMMLKDALTHRGVVLAQPPRLNQKAQFVLKFHDSYNPWPSFRRPASRSSSRFQLLLSPCARDWGGWSPTCRSPPPKSGAARGARK